MADALCVCMAFLGWLWFGIPPDRLRNDGVGLLVAVVWSFASIHDQIL